MARPLVLVVAAFAISGCAPALTTLQPATVAPRGHVDGGIGYGVSIPAGGAVRSYDAARDIAKSVENGDPLSAEDRDKLIEASLGLALNPPSIGSQYQIAVGIAGRYELDLRYALSSWRIGGRYQFLVPPPGSTRLAGTVGLGFSRYVFDLGVPGFLDRVVDVKDFTRYDVDVPILFGISHEIVHVWFGPKFVASFVESSLSVCTQIDTGSGDCTQRASAALDGNALYFAGQAGIGLGYKHAWLAVELTTAFVDVRLGGHVDDGTTRDARRYHFGDFIVYPVVGVILRI